MILFNRWCFVAVGLLLGLSGCHPVQQAAIKPAPASTMQPDRETRALAARIKESEVAQLRFYGPNLMCFQYDPIIVTDQSLIKRFLNALRRAQQRSSIGLSNRVDILEIHFKAGKGRRREPTILHFNSRGALDCFGPDFQQTLRVLRPQVHAKFAKVKGTPPYPFN